MAGREGDRIRSRRTGTGQIGAELDYRLSDPYPQPDLSRFPVEHRLAGGGGDALRNTSWPAASISVT